MVYISYYYMQPIIVVGVTENTNRRKNTLELESLNLGALKVTCEPKIFDQGRGVLSKRSLR